MNKNWSPSGDTNGQLREPCLTGNTQCFQTSPGTGITSESGYNADTD